VICSHPRRVGPRLLGSAALVALLLGAGCSNQADKDKADKDKPKPAAKTPATPREAFLQANEALVSGDEEAFFKAVKFADDPQKEYFKVSLAMTRNNHEFRDAFLKAYGEAAWKRFNDPNIDPGNGEGNSALTVPDLDADTRARLEKATFEEKGDEAVSTAIDPSGKTFHWKFVKVADGWVVDATSLNPPTGADRDNGTKMNRIIADNVKKYVKAIGKPGISADDLDVQLGRAVMSQLYGMEPNGRNRFDINAIKD
jgi:hypothetical protein